MDGWSIDAVRNGADTGGCDRTFRRYFHWYEEGLDELLGKRLTQASSRRAPVDELMELARQCEGR